jgi:hypothetical protein
MNMKTKHEVLQAHLTKWLAAKDDRVRRGELTQLLADATDMHRKSIPRAMRRIQLKEKNASSRSGRPRIYGIDVDRALKEIWIAMSCPCAENMNAIVFSEYVAAFMKEKRWHYDTQTTAQAQAMSVRSKTRRIAMWRKADGTHKGISATTPSRLIHTVPIRKSHTWQGLPPGYVQTDSVVHCGDLLTSDVVYSVGCVDFATYWNEYVAQWNKGQEATLVSIQTIRGRIPFPVCELHPDSGNEFINHHMIAWAAEEGVVLTRSEPYKKNDNMCIEERNGSISRAHLGSVRLDDQSLLVCADEILHIACILHNHFRPVRRMTDKTRNGSKWKRTFESVSKTPYERVLEHDAVSTSIKEQLKHTHEALNPLELERKLATLKEELNKKLRALSV